METTPLETFTSPRKRDADTRLLTHNLFERLMARADIGFEDTSIVQQVLREADAVDIDFITRCIDRAPDMQLADIGYPLEPSGQQQPGLLVDSSFAA